MITKTKSTPIIFSGPMVRAILEGRKTQTRRVIKPQPELDSNLVADFYSPTKVGLDGIEFPGDKVFGATDGENVWKCPYGKPGDRLWVRESVCAEELPDGLDGVRYSADNAFRAIENSQEASDQWCALYNYGGARGRQVPSIHMPRWACRIHLEIVNIRVERINEISDIDCIAEGIEREPHPTFLSEKFKLYGDLEKLDQWTVDPKWSYCTLWESINGAGSWYSNPWVWVVEFKAMGADR